MAARPGSIAWEATGWSVLAGALAVASRGLLLRPPMSVAALGVLVVASVGLAVSIQQGRSGRWSGVTLVASPLLAVPVATVGQSVGVRTVALALPPLAIAGAALWQCRLARSAVHWPTVAVVSSVGVAVVVDLLFRDPYRELLCTPVCPVSPWVLQHRPDLVSAAGWLVLVTVLVAVTLSLRGVASLRPPWTVLIAVLSTNIAMVAGAVALRWRSDHTVDSAFVTGATSVQLLFIGGAAVMALVPVGRTYVGRNRVRRWATAVEGTDRREDAVDLLRLAADDPTVRLVDSPVAAPGRATTTLDRSGKLVAVVEHRQDSAERLRSAISPTVVARLENDLLVERAHRQLDELQGARRLAFDRIEDARSRRQHDLHDGAQQRLIALGMRLSRMATELTGPARSSLDLAAQHAASALDRLRFIAHADVPPLLDDGGLVEALLSLAEDCEVDLALSLPAVPCPRLPREVERAAYRFVVSSTREAASAGAVRLSVRLDTDDGLTVTTSHLGGALTARIEDRDRIEAAAGTMNGQHEGSAVVYQTRFP